MRHRGKQIEVQLAEHPVKEGLVEVFIVAQDQGAFVGARVENALGDGEQFGSGLSDTDGRGVQGQANRLGSFGVQTEEQLRDLLRHNGYYAKFK